MIQTTYKTANDRVILSITIGFKDTQRRILEESSHVGKIMRDKDGQSLLEDFVLDEAYETTFRSYFYSAQAELTEYLSAYTKDMPTTSEYIDTSASDTLVEDWNITLPMPSNFNESLSRAIGIKIEDFVTNYIMWLWLSTKDSSRTEIYLATATKLKEDITNLLNRRSVNLTRPNRYW